MSSQSTIEALKAALQEVEEKKRRIDEDHRGLLIALRYFEGESPDVSQNALDEGIGEESDDDTLDVPW